jgi:ATP-dependent DNA ligase
MVKKDSEYKPGKRTDWGKLKSYNDIDLILVGGYWGKGKR